MLMLVEFALSKKICYNKDSGIISTVFIFLSNPAGLNRINRKAEIKVGLSNFKSKYGQNT